MKMIGIFILAAGLLGGLPARCGAGYVAVLEGEQINASKIQVDRYVWVTKSSGEKFKGYVRDITPIMIVIGRGLWEEKIPLHTISTIVLGDSEAEIVRFMKGERGPDFWPSGQHLGDEVAVYLRDGNKVIGTLKQVTRDSLRVRASIGEIALPRDGVREIVPLDRGQMRGGEYWSPDPNRTRLFVFPTASTLPRGQGFYENYYVLFNGIHAGVSDRAMVSAGIAPFPSGAVFTAGAKVQLFRNARGTVEAALGGQAFVAAGEGETVTMFSPYGVISLGKSDRARLHLGGGGLLVMDERALMINTGADLRVSSRVKLMGELFVVAIEDEIHAFPIYGFRLLAEKVAFDLGFWNIPEEKDLTAFGTPIVNFVFQF